MSKNLKRRLSVRSRSRSRSRSVTPGRINHRRESHARRQLIMAASNMIDRDPIIEVDPVMWKPSIISTLPPTTPTTTASSQNRRSNDCLLPPPSEQSTALAVSITPGGTMNVTGHVPIHKTPRGSIRRKEVLEQSIHLAPIERAAACAMDDEEAEEMVVANNDHLKRWINELPGIPDSIHRDSIPLEAEPEFVDAEVTVIIEEIPPNNSSRHAETHFGFDYTNSAPSTSGTALEFKRPNEVTAAEGSEFDSEFDDEFDVDEIAASGGMDRGIPADHDLDEPERNIVHSLERDMDEAIESLVGVSTSFDWQSDFDTFVGVPEIFSGPSPGAVRDYDTPYDAFIDIWNKDIVQRITNETNRYAKQVIDGKKAAGTLKRSSRLHQWTDTNVDEIYVLFAVYIFMGIDLRTSQHEYWKINTFLEMPKFRQLMSYNRFILLSKFLHFTDNSDVSQDLLSSEGIELPAKLRKLVPIIKHLNDKFGKLYNLQADIAIDESLTLYKGRLSWVQAIRSKAARFGIKSFELCESKTGYLYKFEIYTGKNSERSDIVAPSAALAGKSTQVVLDLLKGLERRGHCVTMDNFYNSPALARYLKSLGFDCLGTLRVNRKHVPEDIAKVSKNVAKGTIIGRHSGDVSCIAWKDTKVVTMISTYHNCDTYVGRKAGRELVKPIAVRDYNNTMGGVDLKDQKLSMYLLERKRCLKWYVKMFKRLLNVSVHNALVLLLSSLGRRRMPILTHRDFREQLANSLIANHCHLPQENLVTVHEIMRLRKDIVHVPISLTSKSRMLCHICLRKGKRQLVSLKCESCNEAMCFGSCWKEWHSLQQLSGKDIQVRQTKRRR